MQCCEFFKKLLLPFCSGWKSHDIKWTISIQRHLVHSSCRAMWPPARSSSQLFSTLWTLANSCKKKKDILQHATAWMDLEDIMLSEISHSQNDRYCPMLPVRSIYEGQSHSIKGWRYGCQRLQGRDMESQINGCKVSAEPEEWALGMCCATGHLSSQMMYCAQSLES